MSSSQPRTPTFYSQSNQSTVSCSSSSSSSATPVYPPPHSPHRLNPNHTCLNVDDSEGRSTTATATTTTTTTLTGSPQNRYGEFEAYSNTLNPHDDVNSPMLRPTSPSYLTVISSSNSPKTTLAGSSSAVERNRRRSSISDPKPMTSSSNRNSRRNRIWWLPSSLLTAFGLYYLIRDRHSTTTTMMKTKIESNTPHWLKPSQWTSSSSNTNNHNNNNGGNDESISDQEEFTSRTRLKHEWWRPTTLIDPKTNQPWPLQGKNASKILTEKGEIFMYKNEFGGSWDARPDSLKAKCQNDTPPLATKWDYSKMTISGVNFGGWLTPEPFITPHIYEPYLAFEQEAVDEYTLSVHLGDRLESVLTHHYETFITEKDFAEVAGAGLNWVRIPLSYWAVETMEGEPFLAHVSWKYFLKAVEWSRKYGLRINLDLHTVPGSANGWNHAGKSGTVNLLNGVMGIANAERTLNIVRALAKFVSLPINRNIIPMFSVLNEPYLNVIGHDALRPFYLKLYDTVRAESGFGDGNGPVIVLHDGFKGTSVWHRFMSGADRVALDSHRYLCFRTPNTDPLPVQSLKPCVNWMRHFNRTMRAFGISMVAEWSIATNDCGRFVNGVHVGTRFEGTYGDPKIKPAAKPGDCEFWEDASQWDDKMKLDLQDIALAHMDAFQNWFYWTWKTGPSLLHPDRPANPMWSYRHGLINGYIPKNPRKFPGFCRKQYERFNRTQEKAFHYSGQLLGWQVGKGSNPGAEIDRGGYTWPPEMIGPGTREGQRLAVKDLPRWSKTAKEGPLAIPDYLTRDGSGGSDEPWYKPIEGCDYLDPWMSVGENIPIPDKSKCQPASME